MASHAEGMDEPRPTGALVTDEPVPTPEMLILPKGVDRDDLETPDGSLGDLGRPFNHESPFFIGLTGALGVAVAYVLARGIADISSVLVIIGLALFIAVGLDPIIAFLVAHGRRRGVAVGIVVLGFVLVIAAFILAAVGPLTHEIQALVKNYPHYKKELIAGKGWAGRLAVKLHLTSYLKGTKKLHIPVDGVLGAGKLLLTATVATVSVIALTIYFLIALPGVKRLFLRLVPRTRRERTGLITDEVANRVGGFMLGNLLTSLISGVGTYVWLLIFGVPYALLLALVVALFDLIPMIGSTLAGIIVSAVAFTRGVPIGIATIAFYVVYRYLEDYLVNPRVMKHTVKVTPGLTIIATLVGGTLLGLIGALVAIPVAATVHLLLEEVAIPRQDRR